jgi:hypothetical protein
MMLEKKNKKKISKKYNQVRRGCICIAAGAKHSRRHSAIGCNQPPPPLSSQQQSASLNEKFCLCSFYTLIPALERRKNDDHK